MPIPLESKYSIDGVEIAVYEWLGADPPILLCHATGFHARCWNRIVARLNGPQHARRCVAFDFRGHGRSGKPEPPYSWRRMGEDLGELVAVLGLRGATGAGHSMGGHALVLAAATNPGAFAALLLLDPVILPPEFYRGPSEPLDFVLRRRNVWTSPTEMIERFKGRPPFQSWDRGVLRDYCEYGLQGTALACPPEVEASIYAHSTALDANIYPEVDRIEAPVHVVRSRLPYTTGSFDQSPTAPDLAARFQHGSDQHLTGISHFIPMEAPALTAELILKLP